MTRRFAADPVDLDRIVELIDDARRAPSAGFAQGTKFVVLGGDHVADFWRRTGAGEWFAAKNSGVLAAPIIVIPVGDPRAYTDRYSQDDKRGHGLEHERGWPVPYWLTDTAMAAQNLLLLLEDAGLGALLFGIFRNERELLAHHGVGPDCRAIGAIAVGVRADDDRPSGSSVSRPRSPLGEMVVVRR